MRKLVIKIQTPKVGIWFVSNYDINAKHIRAVSSAAISKASDFTSVDKKDTQVVLNICKERFNNCVISLVEMEVPENDEVAVLETVMNLNN